MTTFSPATYSNETAARKAMEALRWSNGPVCHHGGETKRGTTERE